MSHREVILDPTGRSDGPPLRAQHHLGELSTFTTSYFGTPVEEDRGLEIAKSCDAVLAGVGD
jgi:hypothetical protein